ncbi:MAG: cysteine methyltransferase, partial [Micrococcales bacterium]|nr:cysteine methyltransferase [Micrococcales bacterium]
MTARHTTLASALGPLTLVADDSVLVGLYFDGHRRPPPAGRLGRQVGLDETFAAASAQVEQYLAGQ